MSTKTSMSDSDVTEMAEQAATAWDEGYRIGVEDGRSGAKSGRAFENPYRRQAAAVAGATDAAVRKVRQLKALALAVGSPECDDAQAADLARLMAKLIAEL